MKKVKFGIISFFSFLAGFLILFLITPNVKYFLTDFMIGVSFFCCCVSFAASILAFIKNKVFQKILGIISIPLSIILLLFCCLSFEENYLKHNRYDRENYFYEKNKKVYYSLGEGYFDYWFENGELKYYTLMGGDGGPGPYYDYLFPHKHEPLLNLEEFLDYYGYKYSIDEIKQKTTIHLDDNEDIILYWGEKSAIYSESGKKIELNSPIIHRNCIDAYSWTSDPRLYTFISVSFLNEAGFLKN